ncbi:MAG: bifunctional GrpB family protein/GNAT family N-acetyltransferase [Pseudomonadota bacterium]
MKAIEVTPYNDIWPKLFEAEALRIQSALGDNLKQIHHIGSTAVPGLPAKPIIDIIATAQDVSACIKDLEEIGYTYKGEYNIPFRFYFSRPGFHLHIYEAENQEVESPELELNIIFRDYLRKTPEAAREYSDLKSELIKRNEKIHPVFSSYALGKDAFIRKILKASGFDKVRMMHCAHEMEWEAAKNFRQRYLEDHVFVSDPYLWTFNHPEHKHFVLYKGVEIIGYAHLQLRPGERATMRIIVIDKAARNQSLGGVFLALCERWLKIQGYASLYIESSPKAYEFYKKHGYIEMEFRDPDGYERDPKDIQIGKIL